ncbi:FUSC family protein [Eubacterium oxidoreducens]|uniref:Fusaric acid resistance protein-like n=1 Tax=Eubacterium oxidoreducens TaxID=1732 RepID=A0A1G6AB68_EUBOX|nr:FUSC family protein [Eubacterium oxidoreducens]SDB05648.1 Fusaric acid resistance protein-like [Eubacterium oxidoreducens]
MKVSKLREFKVKEFWYNHGKDAIAPTCVVTAIFLITYFFFGMENTMIGPFATLSFLRFKDLKRHYSCMAKTFMIYCIMALAAYLALVNLPLCIIVNAAALFWLCALLIDEYQMNNYFPAGMALIFFQIAPVSTPAALGNRILALAASFVIIFLFLFFMGLRKKEDILVTLAGEGQRNCYLLYKAVASDELQEAQRLRSEICKNNRRMSEIVYGANRASFVMYESVNIYSRYIGLFEAFVYESKSEMAMPDKIAAMERLLQRLAYLKSNEIPDNKRLKFRTAKFDLRLNRYRFGMRQVCITMPTLVFAYVSGWPNAYWLTISVFFMLIPFADYTTDRVKQRVLGTVRGIIFCLILFYIFRSVPERVTIMTIFNFLIYSANGYQSMVSYITCSALALNDLETSVTLMLLQRIIYTFAGAGITMLANRYVFPLNKPVAAEVVRSKLEELKAILHEEIPYIENKAERMHRTNECVIKAYMLGNSLTQYTSQEEAGKYLHPYMMEMVETIKTKIDPEKQVIKTS